MKLKTFHIGGIHPPEYKLTKSSPSQSLPLPQQMMILLSQHIGAPAIPVVAVGDKVKVGTLIAKANGFVSANIHSSVSGVVEKIADMTEINGYNQPAIYIRVEGDDCEPFIDNSENILSECTLTGKEIIDRIASCGVVGMGGALFPTHVKLLSSSQSNCDTLIVNAAECEPFLTADHRLMLEKGEEIIIGIELLLRAINARRAVICIENNKCDAIDHMRTLSLSHGHIEVLPLQVKYPQGGERQLIDVVMNRRVPSGKLPVVTGALVQNVATVFAVYEAVQKRKPLIERIVTVSGLHIPSPANFWARVGTPLSYLIQQTGGIPENTAKIIVGGPMMGKTVISAQTPVTKGTSGVLLLSEKETRRWQPGACIRCGRCVAGCPMGLSPYLLAVLSEAGLYERAQKEHIMDCLECGTCNYICPAHRPVLDYIRLGKNKIKEKQIGNQ